jgi:hypothetical protein
MRLPFLGTGEPHMSRTITVRDLHPLDLIVLRDLVRFGVLTNDQTERRYRGAALATDRLALLVAGGFVEPWSRLIKDTSIFSATASGARIAQSGLKATRPSLEHLRHDIAVVDLADYVLAHDPQAEWRTEREVGRVLRGNAPLTRSRGLPNPYGHRPDGLLLTDGKKIAIELEHSDKGDLRYAHICRWFALTVSVDGVRWYVDDDRIVARLRRVTAQHGFAADVDFTYEAFPPGVAIRSWVRS